MALGKRELIKNPRRVAEEALLHDPKKEDDNSKDDDFLIDPRSGEPIKEQNDIIFVDAEQTQERMNPILKNK